MLELDSLPEVADPVPVTLEELPPARELEPDEPLVEPALLELVDAETPPTELEGRDAPASAVPFG